MTVAGHTITAAPLNAVAGEVIEVRWPCTVTKWIDRFGLFGKGQRHGTVEFVVSLTCVDSEVESSACTVAAWLMMGERRRMVLEESPAMVTRLRDGELLHLDAALDGTIGGRALVLTRRGDELVFAQSALLRGAGFFGGSYDPPVISMVAAQRAAASA